MNLWERWQHVPPQIREPIKSAVVAASIALQTAFFTILGAAVEAGRASSPGDFLAYAQQHWWGVAIGILLPAAYRARQARTAAENTVNLPNGGSAVLIPPKGAV